SWEIDPGRRELRSHGTTIVLGSRAFEILEVLAQTEGQLVTKDDLMARVWPGAIVGENTIEVHISAVRKALGTDRGLLKTTKGRGYRLVGGWSVQDAEAIEVPTLVRTRPRSADRPATNLPSIVTKLVGRSSAVQRVHDLVSAYRV